MIELKDVTIIAGQFALRDVSMQIPTGCYGVLMGRTGHGKTTILEAICGLRSVTSGCILIHGTDVTDWSPADREIGYVPQDLALFPTMTVKEHLAFALRIRGRAESEIANRTVQLADELGIAHLMSRKIKRLSGGESQRVALGRALSFNPSMLLLDEPLSALDQDTREDMQNLLTQVKQTSGVTILHVTHNTEEALALADYRYLLQDGTIVQQTASTD